MGTIRAIFEHGVFKPTDRVELPEHCEVEFEPRPVAPSKTAADLHRVLSERYQSGVNDTAARHDEHQP